MKSSILKLCLALFLAVSFLGVTGCEQEGTMEKAGKAMDEAAEDAGKAVDDAMKDAGKAIEEAKQAVEEKMESEEEGKG